MTDTGKKFNLVFLIGDSEDDRFITKNVLTRNNFAEKIIEFTKAERALSYLKETTEEVTTWPDIILLDIHMPGLSGFGFMEAYDTLPEAFKNHCRTYMISSSIDYRDINRAKTHKNVSGFHEKPITKQFLDSILVL